MLHQQGCLQALLLGERHTGLDAGLELLNPSAWFLTTLFCSLGEDRQKSLLPVASMSGGAAPHTPQAQGFGRAVPGFGDRGAPMTIPLLRFLPPCLHTSVFSGITSRK